MMLCTPGLRVALATTHLPLRSVPDAIDSGMLIDIIRIVDRDLRERFAIPEPRIVVCGLNPHAGEGAIWATRRSKRLAPRWTRCARKGWMFADRFRPTRHSRGSGLPTPTSWWRCTTIKVCPVIKHAGFGHAVNVTLGLGFLRTSVDHGTALDLAGTGRAEHSSLVSALTLMQELARARGSDPAAHGAAR